MRRRSICIVVAVVTLAGCGDDHPEQTRPSETMTSIATNPASTLLVCLDSDATSAEVQDLFERVSTPHSSGVGTDLRDGIAAVAARQHGIAVDLEPRITTAQRAELIAILEAEPVTAVREGDSDCS